MVIGLIIGIYLGFEFQLAWHVLCFYATPPAPALAPWNAFDRAICRAGCDKLVVCTRRVSGTEQGLSAVFLSSDALPSTCRGHPDPALASFLAGVEIGTPKIYN